MSLGLWTLRRPVQPRNNVGPADNEADTDGNRHFYGFEAENLGDGQDPWPDAQLEAIEKVGAAICRHHDWTSRSVIGHKEWQPGKVDPRGPDKANAAIKLLGQQLVKRGYGGHYRVGPSKSWGEADRLNVAEFQRAHAQLCGDADGYPGPLTWHILFS